MRKGILISVLSVAIVGVTISLVVGQGQGKSGSQQIQLFKILKDKDANIWERFKAARALTDEYHDERVLPYLFEFLMDKDESIHGRAILTLSSWNGDNRIVEPLIKALKKHKDFYTKTAIIWLLERQLDKRTIKPLIEELADEDNSEKIKGIVAKALVRITFFNFDKGFEYSENRELVGNMEKSAKRWLAWYKINAGDDNLDKVMIQNRINVVVDRARTLPTRKVAINDLMLLPVTGDAVTPLISLAEDKNEDELIRMEALGMISKKGVETIPIYLAIMNDKSEAFRVRTIATAALIINNDQVINALMAIVRDKGEDLRLRQVAAGSLISIGIKSERARDFIDNLIEEKTVNEKLREYASYLRTYVQKHYYKNK